MNSKDLKVDEIDLEGIENDPELLRELAEIGRELDMEATKPINSTKKVSNKSSSTAAVDTQNINLDISHLLSSNTDNLHVDFNEDDENDPELLAALEGLKKDHTDESDLRLSTTRNSTSNSVTAIAATKPIQASVSVSPKPTPAVPQSQTQLVVPKAAPRTVAPSKAPNNTGETSPRSASLIAQYKQKALSFKKEGRLEEAKEWLIKAKNLEKSDEIKGIAILVYLLLILNIFTLL